MASTSSPSLISIYGHSGHYVQFFHMEARTDGPCSDVTWPYVNGHMPKRPYIQIEYRASTSSPSLIVYMVIMVITFKWFTWMEGQMVHAQMSHDRMSMWSMTTCHITICLYDHLIICPYEHWKINTDQRSAEEAAAHRSADPAHGAPFFMDVLQILVYKFKMTRPTCHQIVR